MKQRRRIYYSAAQRSEIWDRWQAGEPMSAIGRRFDRESSSVFSVISPTGGIRPPERARYLTLIYNMYFALGCKVFPDEVTVTPLLTNEYKLLLDANLEFAGEFEKIGNMMEAKALAGGGAGRAARCLRLFQTAPRKGSGASNGCSRCHGFLKRSR